MNTIIYMSLCLFFAACSNAGEPEAGGTGFELDDPQGFSDILKDSEAVATVEQEQELKKEVVQTASQNTSSKEIDPKITASLTGGIHLSHWEGEIKGWALATLDTSLIAEVKVYADGPKDEGVFILSTVADLAQFDDNQRGFHGFTIQIPEEHRLQSERKLYFYASVGGEEKELFSQTFPLYRKTVEGRAFYESRVLPAMQKCKNCHSDAWANYDLRFDVLSNPLPSAGGTPENNKLINMALDIAPHGGNNQCGDIANEPCNLFREWWSIEFEN